MWNYRVVRKRNKWIDPEDQQESVSYAYAIHEAFYDDNGHVGAITEDPVEPFGENMEELRHSWLMMAEAFGQPILDYDTIPELGYDRKEDPLGSVVDKRLTELGASGAEQPCISWREVKRELEEKWGPFDRDGHREEVEHERLQKERIHHERFISAPTLKELIDRMYSDYNERTGRDEIENP